MAEVDLIEQLTTVVWDDGGIINRMRHSDSSWEDLKPEVISLAEKVRDKYAGLEEIPTRLAKLLIDTTGHFANYQYENKVFVDLYLEFIEALGDLAQVE